MDKTLLKTVPTLLLLLADNAPINLKRLQKRLSTILKAQLGTKAVVKAGAPGTTDITITGKTTHCISLKAIDKPDKPLIDRICKASVKYSKEMRDIAKSFGAVYQVSYDGESDDSNIQYLMLSVVGLALQAQGALAILNPLAPNAMPLSKYVAEDDKALFRSLQLMAPLDLYVTLARHSLDGKTLIHTSGHQVFSLPEVGMYSFEEESDQVVNALIDGLATCVQLGATTYSAERIYFKARKASPDELAATETKSLLVFEPALIVLGVNTDHTQWLALCALYEGADCTHSALSCAEKSISINPDFVEGHIARSAQLLELNRLDEARASLQKALELDPLAGRAHLFLGILMGKVGEHLRAVEHFERAGELAENKRDHYTDTMLRTIAAIEKSRCYMRQGLFEQALEECNVAIKKWPTEHLLFVNRCLCNTLMKNYKQALEDSERARNLRPLLASASATSDWHCKRALAYLGQGEAEKAKEEFDSALTLNPRNAEAYFYRSRAFKLLGKQEQAQIDDTKAKELKFKPEWNFD